MADYNFLKGYYARFGSSGGADVYNNNVDAYLRFLGLINSPVGEITSRDQFINPNEIVDPSNYRNTRAGQAQYNSDLAAAQNYLSQQQAAYEEWYNSPEQQAARDRAAGLNPNILGLSGSVAPETNPPAEGSAFAGIPTNGQMALNSLGAVSGALTSVFSCVSNIASIKQVFSQIGLQDSQKESVELDNIAKFEQLVYGAITDRFASAAADAASKGTSFDPDAFFSDDSNFADIISSYVPADSVDDPRYKVSLDRVRSGSQKVLKDAYTTNSLFSDSRKKFLSDVADPTHDGNDLIMRSQLEPVMLAQYNLEMLSREFQTEVMNLKKEYMDGLNVGLLADAVNADAQHDVDYLSTFNGKLQGLCDMYERKAATQITSAKNHVFQYLMSVYRAREGDDKLNAAWMVLSGAHMGWQEFLLATKNAYFNQIMSNMQQHADAATTHADAATTQADAAMWNVGANYMNATANTIDAILPW